MLQAVERLAQQTCWNQLCRFLIENEATLGVLHGESLQKAVD